MIHLHVNRLSIRAGNVHRTIMHVWNLDYARGGSNFRALLLHTVFSSDQQHRQGHAQQNFNEHFQLISVFSAASFNPTKWVSGNSPAFISSKGPAAYLDNAKVK